MAVNGIPTQRIACAAKTNCIHWARINPTGFTESSALQFGNYHSDQGHLWPINDAKFDHTVISHQHLSHRPAIEKSLAIYKFYSTTVENEPAVPTSELKFVDTYNSPLSHPNAHTHIHAE